MDAAFEQRRFQRGNEALVLLAAQVVAVNRRNEDRAFVAIEDGFGRIEATVYSDALRELGDALLQRDAFLLIEGQLHEDRFRGGTGLRLRRAWDITSYCATHGQRLRLTLDTTVPDAETALRETITPYLNGRAPLTLEIITTTARGIVDTDASLRLRTEPALIQTLRALPGISRVALKLARPEAAPPRER